MTPTPTGSADLSCAPITPEVAPDAAGMADVLTNIVFIASVDVYPVARVDPPAGGTLEGVDGGRFPFQFSRLFYTSFRWLFLSRVGSTKRGLQRHVRLVFTLTITRGCFRVATTGLLRGLATGTTQVTGILMFTIFMFASCHGDFRVIFTLTSYLGGDYSLNACHK